MGIHFKVQTLERPGDNKQRQRRPLMELFADSKGKAKNEHGDRVSNKFNVKINHADTNFYFEAKHTTVDHPNKLKIDPEADIVIAFAPIGGELAANWVSDAKSWLTEQQMQRNDATFVLVCVNEKPEANETDDNMIVFENGYQHPKGQFDSVSDVCGLQHQLMNLHQTVVVNVGPDFQRNPDVSETLFQNILNAHIERLQREDKKLPEEKASPRSEPTTPRYDESLADSPRHKKMRIESPRKEQSSPREKTSKAKAKLKEIMQKVSPRKGEQEQHQQQEQTNVNKGPG